MSYKLILVASSTQITQSEIDTLPSNDTWQWIEESNVGYTTIEQEASINEINALREKLKDQRIDVFCAPSNAPNKQLFLADMDSTIVTSETLDELADEAGIKDKIASITERAMRGELDFHDALRERIGLLKGLPESALQKTLAATEMSNGAPALLKQLRAKDIHCVLVSGGFTFFTGAVAEQLSFNNNHGNILNISNGVLDGTVSDPILDKDSKLTYLKNYAQQQQCNLENTIAIGDGANDLPMLENAGLGIGYRPKPLVQESVLNCIIHTDLTSVLYLI